MTSHQRVLHSMMQVSPQPRAKHERGLSDECSLLDSQLVAEFERASEGPVLSDTRKRCKKGGIRGKRN